MINELAKGAQGAEWKELFEEMRDELGEIMLAIAMQEKEWGRYLFKDGTMIGLNSNIIDQLIEYFCNIRCAAIKLDKPFAEQKKNPIGWFNSWIQSAGVQVAPQETEQSSYLVGQVDSTIDEDALDMDL
ncbi:ribonucleotide-diphosphate reductase beta subunit [Vibrio phage BONAISHI]|nr:ribonucleotide-diphosphate reductase beta subunit [Vibrio phage BONAISHI]